LLCFFEQKRLPVLESEFLVMSTATPSPQEIQETSAPPAQAAGRPAQSWLVILLVFVSGGVSLGVEMAASRLLAPYFGTSLFVWANLIGLILLYLTVGYYVGGRLADRFPRPTVLYGITALASLLVALIPPLSRPILHWSLSAFATYSVGVFYGSLVSVILLFLLPMVLLGCVSPFAIRLSVDQVGKSGRIAGLLYAISTAGSILGTFLPVLVLIPNYGTAMTFIIMAAALLLVSIIGLLFSVKPQQKSPAEKARFLSIVLLLPLGGAFLASQGNIKPASGIDDNGNIGGKLLEEHESGYNYIQVVQVGEETQLILNEGLGVHSIYNPKRVTTEGGGPWDYFLIAPFFNNSFSPDQVKKVCIIGLGGGTSARGFSEAYKSVAIDGVEIDQKIVDMGEKYFHLGETNTNVIVQDGRYFLESTTNKYDVIGIDAYQQPYIPFQLTSTEFFSTVRSHLTPNGVAVINVGRTNDDFRLVNAMAQNMKTVFSNVYIVDTLRFTNSLIIGTNAKTNLGNFQKNTMLVDNPLLKEIAYQALVTGKLREEKQAHVYFTDDLAPIEQMIDQIIFNVAQHSL